MATKLVYSTMNDTNVSEDCFPNEEQIDILADISMGCGTISLCCCVFVLFVMLLFKKYRCTIQRLIVYLTIVISIYSVIFILHGVRERISENPKEDDPFCTLLGFLDQVTSWMELITIACLTMDLFVKVIFLRFQMGKLEIVYVLLIFVLPLAFNWIPFIDNAYGFAGIICWIKQYENNDCSQVDKFGLSLRFVLYWIPFYIIVLLIFFAYFTALIKARRRIKQFTGTVNFNEQVMKELLLSEIQQYRLYPIIFALTMTIALISRIAEVINMKYSFFGLRIVHLIALSLQGPIIVVLVAIDKETRQQLSQFKTIRAALFVLFCPCQIRKVQEYEAIIEPNPNDSLSPSREARNETERNTLQTDSTISNII